MKKLLVLLFPLLSFSLAHGQVRHSNGWNTIYAGANYSLIQEGIAYRVGYVYHLDRKNWIQGGLGFESLLVDKKQDRDYYNTAGIPGQVQSDLQLEPFDQAESSRLRGYYFSLSYGYLVGDLGDRLYLHLVGGGRVGYEEAEFVYGFQLQPEIDVYVSPSLGFSLSAQAEYLVNSVEKFRLLPGLSLKVVF